ncbi:MAG: DNA polymerase/3'-5' exonuclease PolX, partial [Spirochaetes bacterium]|nr:DNA polymerase/3'-5' exonuclease PolX [Spirochaetota bacterium]
MDNRGIADTLRRIAVFSELSGENPFKARAFENVARAVEKHPESVSELCAEGRLAEIKGVGKGIAEVIEDVAATGRSTLLERLTSAFPPGITDLLSLSGMGPKRVRAVYESLAVSTLGELEYACRENRLVSLAGFGEKMQANILKAIEFRKTTQSSRLYSEALAIGEELVSLAEASTLFSSAEIAGSLRRGKAVFKDIDILLIPKAKVDPVRIQELLLSFADTGPDGPAVIGAGETKVSIRRQGLQVDFRIIADESHASALQHFTGSKEHNTLLRSRAKAMGLKMSEYGVFDSSGKVLPSRSESDVYQHVGLAWIPAEIREADGEIEAAEAGSLPVLVEPRDIRGMIHVHTSASDGSRSLEELARECIRRGYAYLCVSDHSRTAAYAGGLSIDGLRAQAVEAASLNASLAPFRIFHGIESDILSDGALDYPDAVLDALDFVIGSVLSKLSMASESATERLLKAISNPRLTILGHPSGRLLLSREGYPYDEERVLAALAANGVALEHNCNPHRLDPGWEVL